MIPTEKKLTIRILRDGSIVAEADGYSGETCLTALNELLAGIGTETSAVAKPEFYLLPEEKQTWLTSNS